jgi:hypothetical protein
VSTSSIPVSAGWVVWILAFALIGFRLGPPTREALGKSRPLTAVDQLVATRLSSPRELALSPQGSVPAALDWSRIHSTNYPTYLRNLREVGCPPRTLRNILLADIHASFDARKALRPSDPGYLAPEALERERQQITTALLAEIGWKDDSVPAEALLPVLAERLEVLHQSIPFDPARPREWELAIEAAEREFLEAAAREVPKEELAEFELRHSIRSRSLAYEMRYFQPNEKEFRAIFTAKGPGGPVALPTLTDESRQDDIALVSGIHSVGVELKSALGPDRFKAYLRTEQPAYRNMARLVERLKLPPEALDASLDAIVEAENRSFRGGTRLPPGDPYPRELRERLDRALGPGGAEKALEVYPIPFLLNP